MDIAHLAGLDAVKLVRMIMQAAQKVRHNKKICQQLVHHVQIVGDLLKKLQTSEMMQQPEIRNGLNELEEILREGYMLVTSCGSSSYIYHFFMGGQLADQFRVVQSRIDSSLQVFPLISHIDTSDRLDQILEIIQPRRTQAVKGGPRLFNVCATSSSTGCFPPDARIEAHREVERCSLQSYCTGSVKFYLSQLVDATENFSDGNKIGQGSFGCVYKDQLHDGLEVAVKRCFELPSSRNQMDFQDLEFQNEICFLGKLQHTNVVKLLGYCIQGTERILVYEYMLNGSVDTFIFGMCSVLLHLNFGSKVLCRLFHLDWSTRSRIINGIAEGLLYLHKHCGLHIVHGDLKPSNILLDSNMNPKISDFGLARRYSPGVDEEYADRILGSIGFIAPECRERRLFSTKSDVYGFGALVLEIISGKRCFSLASGDSGDDYGFLNKRAWHLWRTGRLIKLADSPSGDEFETREILRCIHIALLCVEENPANRPTIQEVVLMLSCQTALLPKPRCPAYLRAEIVLVADKMSRRCLSKCHKEEVVLVFGSLELRG
uniref:Protein kinase domain-containing protein n=1 Tax=Oryza nivara TaxID=4536 RepID=A0A0E0J599_ORYNI